MQWNEICKAYPNEWLIIEAIQAHSTSDHKRLLDKIDIIERCVDSGAAMRSYRRLHIENPMREFYFVHTSREELDIREQQWLGVRSGHAVTTER